MGGAARVYDPLPSTKDANKSAAERDRLGIVDYGATNLLETNNERSLGSRIIPAKP